MNIMWDVNWWAVLVSAVIFYVLGAVWYSLFSKEWMKGAGFTEEKRQGMTKGHSAIVFVMTFLFSLVLAYVVACIVKFAGTTSFGSALWLGILLWKGFILTSMGINYLYEGKSFKFFLINSGYFFFGILEMSVLFSVWK